MARVAGHGRRVLSDTSTALFRDGYIYSPRSFGEFVCLDAKTGKQLWETDKVTDRKSGASVHPTANSKSVLLYNDRGELIRAQLTAAGYREISRARVLEPAATFSGRKCAWAAPAYANHRIYARTNKELVCASLAADDERLPVVQPEPHAAVAAGIECAPSEPGAAKAPAAEGERPIGHGLAVADVLEGDHLAKQRSSRTEPEVRPVSTR